MALLAALQHCEKGEFAAAQQLYEECVDGTPPPSRISYESLDAKQRSCVLCTWRSRQISVLYF